MVDQHQEAIVMMKGKRTKRPRPLSPVALTPTTAEEDSGPRGGENCSEAESAVEWAEPMAAESSEEEDMAHCLILLAQGSKPISLPQQVTHSKPNNVNNNNNNSSSSNNNNNSNGNSYECKTCNKSFPSFQALGGHRASHKKLKLGISLADYQTNKKPSIYSLLSGSGDDNQAHHQLYDHHRLSEDEIALSLHITSTNSNASSHNNNNNNNNSKAKVHECGICGAEFSSGQALGGHMRRHRPIGGTTSAISTVPTSLQSSPVMVSNSSNNDVNGDNQEIKTHNFLSLDLNLPAPEDDHQSQQQEGRDNSKFVFPLSGKTLVFSASSLVDCHY